MRMPGQAEGARRRLDLTSPHEVRGVEVVRGRVGYGFTLSGQGPCLLSGILEGSPADQVGLKQGDRIVSVNGTDVAKASHEAVVQLIGTCKGPLRLVVLVGSGPLVDLSSSDEELSISRTEGKVLFQKGGVFRTVSDHSGNSSSNSVNATPAKPRPVSEPDMSHWIQPLNYKTQPVFLSEEETARVADSDSVFNDQEDDVNPDWSILNTAMVVGYLGSTELILALSRHGSEDDCLQVIRRCIRLMGTEQETHTLVMMKIMFDCVRLCDDTGAVLAAFPAENLVLGVVCSEDRRFFCLVTTAHISGGHVGQNGPLSTSCHVFFIDPELCHHSDHLGITGRFGFDCTPDPDTQGCLEFPLTPPSVLQFVSVLYCDMGEAVERLRTRLDRDSAHHLHTQQNGSSTGKNGSASSNGDSGIGNASPPEERADRDFPIAHGNDPGGHLPSCPWEDYPQAEGDLTQILAHQNGRLNVHPNPGSTNSLSESLPGPALLTGPSGGPPPRLEFQFKPPPPPYPLAKNQKQNLTGGGPFRSSQCWFSMSVKQRWPKGRGGEPESQATPATNSWSGPATLGSTNALPPPMSQIPPDRYLAAEAMMLLPQREEWSKRLWRVESGELLNGNPRKDANTKGSKFWGIGAGRSSGRRSFGHSKRLSLARSLDDLEGDNRHSVPVWERVRECSAKHCSVTLPDGSCSSVTLRPGATIREVLRDLCQKLCINMVAVDLFLVGGEKPLVLDQDCMTLSSRDLRMEKRTLFRLDLVPINRSVGLKAKPTKPVTEVLRPVVAKYGLHLNDLVAKISGETEPLDLGAPISSLDGLRIVLERANPATSGKDSKSKSASLKAHLPSLTSRSLSATGDDRSSGKASGPDPSLPTEKRKPKKINIDEAEEFFELLSRAQSSRRNAQRGLLNKEDLELPDFLRLTPCSPSTASLDVACSTPASIEQGQVVGRLNGVGGTPARGPLNASLRSESLDSSLSSANGHSHSAAGRRALHPPRHPISNFGATLSPIPRPLEARGPGLRTLEEDTHADLTLVGEGDINSPNSTLLPPSPAPLSHEGSLPEANFTPPAPCTQSSQDGCGNGQSSSERRKIACDLDCSHKRAPCLGALRSQPALQEVMDVEGVCLEEGEEEGDKVGEVTIIRGEDSELSLSFQGYATELRQCQSRMKTSQVLLNAHDQSEGIQDSKTDMYKATIV
ncbi:regulator of G-protein signaling 12 [Coregonus clupeaformis]|uniref:regulator of G-protein signaling 12 n=1 Tax=Coregonus clupeaformis TaxID=59861 RepID=UPI001E1C8EDC|nr:regulator of G-protein signaling 12 [Coregonus clupeaformis]